MNYLPPSLVDKDGWKDEGYRCDAHTEGDAHHPPYFIDRYQIS